MNVSTTLPRHVGIEYYRIKNGYRIYLVNFKHPEASTPAMLEITAPELTGSYQLAIESPFMPQSAITLDAIDNKLTIQLPAIKLMGIITISNHYHPITLKNC
jgi:hypothetical protein